jgi:hypothetical protein
MGHIPGNKNLIGSIEVPIDRSYPDEVTAKVLQIVIFMFMDVASFQSEKMPKRGGTKGYLKFYCETP